MLAACVHHGDGSDGDGASRWEDTGRAWNALQSIHPMSNGSAWPHQREMVVLPWGVPGGGEERDEEEAKMFSSAFRYIFAPKCLWHWSPEHLGTSQ